MTGSAVPKTGRRSRRSSPNSALKSGPRWSMVGADMARRTSSGTLLGPGIWRKWRPVVSSMAILSENIRIVET